MAEKFKLSVPMGLSRSNIQDAVTIDVMEARSEEGKRAQAKRPRRAKDKRLAPIDSGVSKKLEEQAERLSHYTEMRKRAAENFPKGSLGPNERSANTNDGPEKKKELVQQFRGRMVGEDKEPELQSTMFPLDDKRRERRKTGSMMVSSSSNRIVVPTYHKEDFTHQEAAQINEANKLLMPLLADMKPEEAWKIVEVAKGRLTHGARLLMEDIGDTDVHPSITKLTADLPKADKKAFLYAMTDEFINENGIKDELDSSTSIKVPFQKTCSQNTPAPTHLGEMRTPASRSHEPSKLVKSEKPKDAKMVYLLMGLIASGDMTAGTFGIGTSADNMLAESGDSGDSGDLFTYPDTSVRELKAPTLSAGVMIEALIEGGLTINGLIRLSQEAGIRFSSLQIIESNLSDTLKHQLGRAAIEADLIDKIHSAE